MSVVACGLALGILTADVPPDFFRKGDNEVCVRASAPVVLRDLSLEVRGR